MPDEVPFSFGIRFISLRICLRGRGGTCRFTRHIEVGSEDHLERRPSNCKVHGYLARVPPCYFVGFW